jgi:hypothetical protein
MSDDPKPPTALTEADRLRRRADVFGEVLPERTSDETGDETADAVETEVWLRRQVPPHHG